MDRKIAANYSSSSQKIRVMTESWVGENIFCPYCGNKKIVNFENNRPVADYFCPHCNEEYELKSKGGSLGSKVNDGAYSTMIERINSIKNPNFFFMSYKKETLQIENFIFVPKYFFSTEIIEKRKPLSNMAKRAGWVGCNILLEKIPKEGRIFIIKDKKEIPINEVVLKARKTSFIKKYNMDARGWILDILNCINNIDNREFSLREMYEYANILSLKHPNNHHVKEKIRQQLQVLRDKGIIDFLGNGKYRKIVL